MKTTFVKAGFLLMLMVGLFMQTEAQTNKAKPKPKAKPKTTGTRTAKTKAGSAYGNPAGSAYGAPAKDTGTKGAPASSYGAPGSAYGAPASGSGSGAPRPANLPIRFVNNKSGGLGDSVKQSLRVDNIIDRQLVKDRTPLPYEHIREDDAVYKQRIWREIDIREKMNLPFRHSANEDNGNQRFISILFSAVTDGPDSSRVTAFDSDDDRFTIPLTSDKVKKQVTGGYDTSEQFDMAGNVIALQVRAKQINPDSIYRFHIKEEVVFDKESSRMFTRILGIAPVMARYNSLGMYLGDQILFWVYYPDLRATLAKYEVYNGKNYGGRMSWEELFESRMFSSYIIKTTMENPYDKSLLDIVKGDKLFRLWEGENIKDKIFNYEQNLWSY